MTKAEIKEFDKFLDSPFFGCSKFVLNFYRTLIKFYPEFNGKDILKEKLFSLLYGSREYNDALTRRMTSDLIRLSEEFLLQKNFRNNSPLRSSCMLNELRKRNLEDHFRIRSEAVLKKISSSESTDPYSLLETYFVNLEVKEFRTLLRDSKMHESYRTCVEAFTVLFLRIIFPYIRHISTFSEEIRYSSGLIDSFISNFDNDSFLNQLENTETGFSLYLKMLIYAHKIGTDNNDRESYFKLKELIENKRKVFSENELKNIYITIIIFLTYQNEQFDNIFLDESFALYNLFLSEYYLNNPKSKIQLSFCRNYINLCNQKEETGKIREFNKKFTEQFPAEYKEDIQNFCEANYLFQKKKFERSLNHASKVNVDRDIFKKDIKILKLKNYYELGYFESSYSELDNLKHLYSASNNLKPETIRKGKKFIRIFSSLLDLKTGKVKTDIGILEKQLTKEKSFYEMKWISEKIKELK
ncbi:MAG: hypothetical protein JSS91_13865 [Bacteroidetes bacterium]|nr:hypothetical protein [Bacteroidota bacterium]